MQQTPESGRHADNAVSTFALAQHVEPGVDRPHESWTLAKEKRP
jgi:hypothetical protein